MSVTSLCTYDSLLIYVIAEAHGTNNIPLRAVVLTHVRVALLPRIVSYKQPLLTVSAESSHCNVS